MNVDIRTRLLVIEQNLRMIKARLYGLEFLELENLIDEAIKIVVDMKRK